MRSHIVVVLCGAGLALILNGCPRKGDSIPVGPTSPSETSLNHAVGTRLVYSLTRTTNDEPDGVETVTLTVLSRTDQNGTVSILTNDERIDVRWVLSNGRLSMVAPDTEYTQVIGPWPATKDQTFSEVRRLVSDDGSEVQQDTLVYRVLNADTLVTTNAGQFRCAHVEITQPGLPLGYWSITRYLYNGSIGLIQQNTEVLATFGTFEIATKQLLVLDNILR